MREPSSQLVTYHLAEPIIISNASRPPFGTVIRIGSEDFSCTRIELNGERVDLYVKRGKLVVERSPTPNPPPKPPPGPSPSNEPARPATDHP